LFYVCFSHIVCRFGECQHPETARIARLTARWAQCYLINSVKFHIIKVLNLNKTFKYTR
jgi:hypothetical protein